MTSCQITGIKGEMASQPPQNFTVRPEREPKVLPIIRKRFYTVGEISLMLGVSEWTVWHWLRRGNLLAVTYGEGGSVRIRGSQLMAFIKPYVPRSKRTGRSPSEATPRSRAARRATCHR